MVAERPNLILRGNEASRAFSGVVCVHLARGPNQLSINVDSALSVPRDGPQQPEFRHGAMGARTTEGFDARPRVRRFGRRGRRGNGGRMRIFSRYVFRQAAGSFLLILVSLTGVVWIALALRQFNVVTSEGQDTWMLIKMTSLALPNLMAIIAPFSFLIAALHTLTGSTPTAS